MTCGMIARAPPPAFTSLATLAMVAAAALLPTTAHAAIAAPLAKAANTKRFAVSDTCRARAAFASPALTSVTPSPIADQLPSALDRMRMSQERPMPIVDVTPARGEPATVRAVATGADRLFKPVRPPSMSLAQTASAPRVDCAAQAAAMASPAFDDDSELGTLAIQVETTRFDDRWARVRRPPAVRLMRAQLDRAVVNHGIGEAATLERVNLWVNRQIAYVDDERNYRQRDFWATADETVARGSGDCEDFAILKMHMLRAAGIDDDRMKLVLLRDLALNADHAFLLVRSASGWVVLDNMTDRIYDGRQSDAMRPILSFSGSHRWVHGYRDAAAPTLMAALSEKAEVSSAGFASASAAVTRRTASKTALVSIAGARLALAHLSIVNELPKMFGRLPSRGAK